MTKEYLKMADVFTLPVKDEDRESAVEVFSRMVSAPYSVDYTVALSQYAAHAINSHDELVKKLQTAESTLDEVERVLAEAQKNGNYYFDDLLADVIYAIKRINEE